MKSITEIKKMLEEISRWPWCEQCSYTGIRHLIRNCYDDFKCDNNECKIFDKYDGIFISKSPEIISQLVSEVERLKDELEKTKLHKAQYEKRYLQGMDTIQKQAENIGVMREALEFYADDISPFIVPDYLWDQGCRVQTKAIEALKKVSI